MWKAHLFSLQLTHVDDRVVWTSVFWKTVWYMPYLFTPLYLQRFLPIHVHHPHRIGWGKYVVYGLEEIKTIIFLPGILLKPNSFGQSRRVVVYNIVTHPVRLWFPSIASTASLQCMPRAHFKILFHTINVYNSMVTNYAHVILSHVRSIRGVNEHCYVKKKTEVWF